MSCLHPTDGICSFCYGTILILIFSFHSSAYNPRLISLDLPACWLLHRTRLGCLWLSRLFCWCPSWCHAVIANRTLGTGVFHLFCWVLTMGFLLMWTPLDLDSSCYSSLQCWACDCECQALGWLWSYLVLYCRSLISMVGEGGYYSMLL